MKLFLTSTGLKYNRLKKEFLNLAGEVKGLEVLLMYGAKNEKQLQYARLAEQELIDTGFEKSKISHINFSKNKVDLPKKFDVIYFCGGNTFYILDRIKKLKLNQTISNFIKNDGLYIGVSAGSIIVGPSIEIAGYGSEADENDVNLKNLDGLNLINFSIYPHYIFKLRKELNEFSKNSKYPIQKIKDNQTVIVLNEKVRKI